MQHVMQNYKAYVVLECLKLYVTVIDNTHYSVAIQLYNCNTMVMWLVQ